MADVDNGQEITEELILRRSGKALLRDVTTLDLSGDLLEQQRFKKISKIEHLNGLPKLAELSLSGNNIRKIENLSVLLRLTTLNLSNNCIIKVENLDTLSSLEHLDLSRNNIQRLSFSMKKLTSLRSLFLQQNQLSNISDFERLQPLEQLRKLAVEGNPFDQEALHRLKLVYFLPGIADLDGVSVTNEERDDANATFSKAEMKSLKTTLQEKDKSMADVQAQSNKNLAFAKQAETTNVRLREENQRLKDQLKSVTEELDTKESLYERQAHELADATEKYRKLEQQQEYRRIDNMFGDQPSTPADHRQVAGLGGMDTDSGSQRADVSSSEASNEARWQKGLEEIVAKATARERRCETRRRRAVEELREAGGWEREISHGLSMLEEPAATGEVSTYKAQLDIHHTKVSIRANRYEREMLRDTMSEVHDETLFLLTQIEMAVSDINGIRKRSAMSEALPRPDIPAIQYAVLKELGKKVVSLCQQLSDSQIESVAALENLEICDAISNDLEDEMISRPRFTEGTNHAANDLIRCKEFVMEHIANMTSNRDTNMALLDTVRSGQDDRKKLIDELMRRSGSIESKYKSPPFPPRVPGATPNDNDGMDENTPAAKSGPVFPRSPLVCGTEEEEADIEDESNHAERGNHDTPDVPVESSMVDGLEHLVKILNPEVLEEIREQMSALSNPAVVQSEVETRRRVIDLIVAAKYKDEALVEPMVEYFQGHVSNLTAECILAESASKNNETVDEGQQSPVRDAAQESRLLKLIGRVRRRRSESPPLTGSAMEKASPVKEKRNGEENSANTEKNDRISRLLSRVSKATQMVGKTPSPGPRRPRPSGESVEFDAGTIDDASTNRNSPNVNSPEASINKSRSVLTSVGSSIDLVQSIADHLSRGVAHNRVRREVLAEYKKIAAAYESASQNDRLRFVLDIVMRGNRKGEIENSVVSGIAELFVRGCRARLVPVDRVQLLSLLLPMAQRGCVAQTVMTEMERVIAEACKKQMIVSKEPSPPKFKPPVDDSVESREDAILHAKPAFSPVSVTSTKSRIPKDVKRRLRNLLEKDQVDNIEVESSDDEASHASFERKIHDMVAREYPSYWVDDRTYSYGGSTLGQSFNSTDRPSSVWGLTSDTMENMMRVNKRYQDMPVPRDRAGPSKTSVGYSAPRRTLPHAEAPPSVKKGDRAELVRKIVSQEYDSWDARFDLQSPYHPSHASFYHANANASMISLNSSKSSRGNNTTVRWDPAEKEQTIHTGADLSELRSSAWRSVGDYFKES